MSKIESPVSGKVWKVEKTTGQVVADGDVVLIVESMKMEIPVEAIGAGTVTVLVAEGDMVQEGQLVAMVS